jgi:hypothetical protein
VSAKGIGIIFNKIIAENLPNLKKEIPIQVQEVSRTPKRHEQNSTTSQHIKLNTISTENKERKLKTVREKHQITNKGKHIKIKDFSTETLKASREYNEVFQALEESNFKPRILYPIKL